MPNWKKVVTSGSNAELNQITGSDLSVVSSSLDYVLVNDTLHVSGASDVLLVEGSGSTVFEVQGSEGQLFSITDDLTGDLLSVSDISGIPIFNVNASGDSYFTDQLEVQGLLTGSTADFSGTVTASAYIGDGSALTNLPLSSGIISSSQQLPSNIVSSSNQLASNISGSFTATSSSLASRISSNETITAKTLISSSIQIGSEISGSFTATSASFATTIDNLPTGDITSVTAGNGLSGGGSSGAVTLTSEYLLAVDDRDMKPNTSGVGSSVYGVKPFLTSLGGMTSTADSDYQDVLVLDTYPDTSAGNANALSFDKSTQLIRHWQAGQTATSWGTPKTLAYLESPSFTGNVTVAGNITAQEFHTEFVSASILYQSGSTKFGDTSDDVHSFTGSLNLDGTVTATAFAGDGSALTGVSVAEATTIVDSFTSQTSVTTTHNFGTKNVLVNVYDSNDAYIIPSSITTTNDNTVTTTFNVSTSGRVVVAKGGHVVGGTSANPQHNSIGVGTAASTTAGEIRATNDITAFYSSDKRLKSNITNIESPLDKLNKINGVTFDWIETPGVHSHTGSDIGVIAQEIEEVLPDIVTTRDNGYKAVKYDKLVALLIESNKELNKKVEELQIKVDNLLKTQ